MIEDNPTHLNCPYCPAQSYPLKAAEINIAPNVYLQRFECPAKHFFYIPEDTGFKYGWNSSEEN